MTFSAENPASSGSCTQSGKDTQFVSFCANCANRHGMQSCCTGPCALHQHDMGAPSCRWRHQGPGFDSIFRSSKIDSKRNGILITKDAIFVFSFWGPDFWEAIKTDWRILVMGDGRSLSITCYFRFCHGDDLDSFSPHITSPSQSQTPPKKWILPAIARTRIRASKEEVKQSWPCWTTTEHDT